MSTERPNPDRAGESFRRDHRLYSAHANWPLSPETPPLQTARPPFGTNTFGSIDDSSFRNTEGSLASDRPVSPPTAVPHAPTPPSGTTEAASGDFPPTDDLYGPDRLFGPPLASDGAALPQAVAVPWHPARYLAVRDTSNIGLGAIFSHGVVPSFFMDDSRVSASPSVPNPALINSGQYFKDTLARDAGNVTPGVDDTPYVLYALDALTGNVTMSTSGGHNSNNSNSNHSSFPYRHIPDDGLGYYRPRSFPRADTNIGTASIKLPTILSPIQQGPDHRLSAKHGSTFEPQESQPSSPPPPEPVNSREPRVSTTSSLSTLVYSDMQPRRASLPAHHHKGSWIYLDLENFSPQAQLVFPAPNFKPAIMRPVPLGLLIIMCLLMTAGLIFCAVYSNMNDGLTTYGGSIYGVQFFLFRVLPQLLSVVVLLYAQSLALAIVRIHPFSRMQALEHPHPQERNGAIFDDLYPRSFLWPQISSAMPWRTWIPLLAIWLINFAVPVQSALFSVILVDGTWRWATVQGVAWTLVALYACLTAAILIVLVDWHGRSTGLIWDPRSIADYVTLASNSNTMPDYSGGELLATRDDLRGALHHRAIDKLGYWTWRDGRTNGVWHGIGTDQLDDTWYDLQGPRVKSATAKKPTQSWNEKLRARGSGTSVGVDVEALALSPHSESVRYRYLPWCLRDGPLLCFIVTAIVLLVALFVVSFLPSTSIRQGFLPLADARSTTGAFSAANFLYSFLPALLGQTLFLLFSFLDLTLRILQPWAELSMTAGGAQPEASILADYAACLPLQSAWHAARNRHWRVAALSFMSTCFAFLPALSGGLFMALTVSTGEIRMVPNMALYAFVLGLLILYFVCLVFLLPSRQNFRLPHAVTCTAEILSFCASDDLMQEPAFKNAHNKATLLNQLGINSLITDRSRWIFATGTSGDDRRLGIRRVRRYTELTNRPSGRRPPQMSNR